MSRTVTLYLEDDAYEELEKAAVAYCVPLAPMIVTLALDRVREGRLVDDVEMAEIAADDGLLARLRSGSKEAASGKGQFAE